MSYLCKVNGDRHIFGAPSRPRAAQDWEGKSIQVPFPRNISKDAPITQISVNDEIWIWTHEGKEFGNGLGLTALVKVGSINNQEDKNRQFETITMKDVKLLKPHFRLEEIPSGESGSLVIEAIRGHRHFQTIEMEAAILSEFIDATERLRAEKQEKIESANANLNLGENSSLEKSALRKEKSKIEENLKSRFTRQVIRPQQALFRDKLLNQYNRTCAITGCQVTEVLQAAHVVPFSEGGDFRDSCKNGILLRADIHQLLDRMLLSINYKNMRICIAESLGNSE